METESNVKPESKPAPRAKRPVKSKVKLTIPEKLFILTIDDQGIIAKSVKTALQRGLATARLAELALANKIKLDNDRLAFSDATPTGDPLFDEILVMLTTEKKPHKLSFWVRAIEEKGTVKQMASRLVERNVIVLEKKHYGWVSPYEGFPRVNASAKYSIKQHLRGILLAGEKAEAPDIALLTLLKAGRLLRLVLTRDERKSANKKVAALLKGEVLGESVSKLLTEIETANQTDTK